VTADHEITHADVRERFGLPTEQVGSVNDPRTHEEHGVRWNEKWIWLLPDGAKRLVYWHRYDFRGAFIEAVDGGVRPEPV
jgi:hypothetical protein